MNIPFSDNDVLVIYNEFLKKLNLVNQIKNSPGNPIHADNIHTDFKIYSSITEKIEEAYPQFKEMKKYM